MASHVCHQTKWIIINPQEVTNFVGYFNKDLVCAAILHELGHCQQKLASYTPDKSVDLYTYENDAWEHASVLCEMLYGHVTMEFKQLRAATLASI
jgi:oligoendopeptidase F